MIATSRIPIAYGPAVMATLLGLAGCAPQSPKGVREIVYWTGWSGHEYEVQQRILRDFHRTHPRIHVRMLSQFGNSGYQKVRIAFAGGSTPDIMSTVWADELAGYARRGVLTPLDRYLQRAGRNVDREYTTGVARMLRIDGRIYGLTATTNTQFIAYNRRIFREAGLDPDRPPRTIAELDAAAAACTRYARDGSFVRYGIRPAGLNTWAYVFGGRWYDPDTGRVTANDPHNVRALAWLASYSRRYDIRKMEAFQSTFGSSETPNGPFFVGKVAMWQTGEWADQYIRRYAPRLDWAWFPLPYPPEGRPMTTTAGGSVFVIPEASRNKEAAFTFLNWWTRPRPVERFCRSIGNVPPLILAGSQPSFQRDPLQRFAVRLSRSPNSFGPPPLPFWPTYAREITRAEEKACLGGQDPGRLLDDLQRRMVQEQRRVERELAR